MTDVQIDRKTDRRGDLQNDSCTDRQKNRQKDGSENGMREEWEDCRISWQTDRRIDGRTDKKQTDE